MLLNSCKDEEILPPLSTSGISATAGDGQVVISWNNVVGAISYNIYWSESAGVTTTNGILISKAVSPHTHTGLSFGTTYYYVVVAVNEAGEGSPSGEVSATIRPLIPQNVSASPGEGEVTISWDNVAGASSYNIYWSESAGVTLTNGTLISNAVSPYTHMGLILGSNYYYIITALNDTGESDPSLEINATLHPAAPQNLNTSVSGDQVTISWDSVSGATTYNIYWSLSAGVTAANGALISNAVSPYTHMGLTLGSNYYYIITALNDTGESDPSLEINAVPGCIDVPSGIISWWPADGDGTDIAGINNGTFGGLISFATGKVGRAFNFITTQDNVTANASGISEQQLTIEAWVQHRSLITKIDRYLTITNEKAVLRHDGNNGPNQLHFFMNINGTLSHVRANNVLQVGVWHHVAGTYNGSIMRMYLDGVEVGNLVVSGIVADGSNVAFGGDTTEKMDGLIDEAAIYNRALTANEIAAIYKADIAGKCK